MRLHPSAEFHKWESWYRGLASSFGDFAGNTVLFIETGYLALAQEKCLRSALCSSPEVGTIREPWRVLIIDAGPGDE